MKSYFLNFLISFNVVVGEVNKTHIALISFKITFCRNSSALKLTEWVEKLNQGSERWPAGNVNIIQVKLLHFPKSDPIPVHFS